MSETLQHGRVRRPRSRRGFTLIELVVTIAITSVIMLGIGSAMLIAGRALPDADNPAAASVTAGQAIEQMVTELQYAATIIDSDATLIEFTVADRDADNVDETIRYEWSGTPGDPLTRQYNGGALVNLVDDVRQFDLWRDVETSTTEVPQGNESSETLLASYYATADQAGRDVKADRWRGQYFLPSLPADTVSWKVTRVRFYAAAQGAVTGRCQVQLQLPTIGEFPSGTVLEDKTLQESTLSPLYWSLQEFTFSNVSGLSPEHGLCLVLEWVSGTEACQVLIRDEDAPPAAPGFMRSTNQGIAWTRYSDQSLLFWVYGTVTTEGEPLIESTYYLDRVTVTLQAGTDAQSTVQAGVRLLNRPEVTQ